MIQALTTQRNQANKILFTYGKDTSGLVEYRFNSSGFRNNSNFDSYPDLIVAGGSINFGIGVDLDKCYWSLLATQLQYKTWNCSYAGSEYNNNIIYKTVLSVPEELRNLPIIIQWVSDSYDVTDTIKCHEYADKIKQKFTNSINLLVDADNTKTDFIDTYFDLINPPWSDTDKTGSHPGTKTHINLAKWFYTKYFKNH